MYSFGASERAARETHRIFVEAAALGTCARGHNAGITNHSTSERSTHHDSHKCERVARGDRSRLTLEWRTQNRC